MPTDPVYGLLQLGELDLALPLSALREVVPRPERLTPLPVATTGLVGAMGLRSMVLPVIDLRPLLGLADTPPADQVVVVVAHDHHVVGLVVDRVLGVTRVPDADLVELSTAHGELLVSHAFQHEDPARPVSVLAAAHLHALPGIPRVAEQPAAVAVHGTGTGRGESLTLVRCGDQVLALEVASIHTTIPLTDVRRSMLTSGDCLGVTSYAGREVPVVDPMTLVGTPPLGEDDVRSGVVLDLGPGYVVLAVTDLVELRTAGDGVLPVPGFAHHRPDLVRGAIEVGSGACLVVDGAGLRAEPSLLALASVNVELAVATDAGGELVDVLTRGAAGATGGPAYLTYTAGVALASPLEQVVEILPYAEALTPSPVKHVAGFLVHRGRTVPVVPLARVLGQEPGQRGPSSCLLLVELGEERVALAVDSLGGIEPLEWTDPDHRRVSGELAHAVQDAPLVRLAGGSRLVPALDLQDLAAALGLAGALRPVVEPAAA
ncbi:chemotaxis protein CheW [Nocardioides mangrovi]|uniref:Chemotaxis protein CheW n=1 Tax=Nocardioides mangrovi TaxID=2874580 RepID=A0ABS7UJA9_9ACTN|nr:chemotaxis protein CheW [Nocardioides mangrovi]MBZ5740870.1 chemotaxis protein CheW [Nocardioides mangrovi]